MKKSIISLAASLMLASTLSAQTIEVTSDWKLLGAINDISSMAHFKSDCVSIVWTFDEGKWSSYKPSLSTNALTQIASGKGFWVKGLDDGCNIDFTAVIEDVVTGADSDAVMAAAEAIALAGSSNGQTGDSVGDVSGAAGSAISTVNGIGRALRDATMTYNDAGYMSVPIELPDGSSVEAIVKFYDASTDAQITEDITSPSNWMMGGALSSYLTIDMVAQTGYPDLSKLYMIIEVDTPDNMQMPAGSVSLGKLVSDKVSLPSSPDSMPEMITFNANGVITMNNGDSWEQKDMVLNTYPATPDKIDGSYSIEEQIDGSTYTGVATFDQTGCLGATISQDGEEVGVVHAKDGELYLTVDGEEQKITFDDLQ